MTRTVKALIMTSAIAVIAGIFFFSYVALQGALGTNAWVPVGMAVIIAICVSIIIAVAVMLIGCGLEWVMQDDGEVERAKAEQKTVKHMLEMGTESLNPDSYIDLERIVGELRHTRKMLKEN